MDRPLSDEHAPEIVNSEDAANYLSRCQVDTPAPVVELVWRLVNERRPTAGRVVDFGCGDARFARAGQFQDYTGYEIDPQRLPKETPAKAKVKLKSAFSATGVRGRFDTCIGNPPYVRHHDLSSTWLETAEKRLGAIEGYVADGRSNAYIYFT